MARVSYHLLFHFPNLPSDPLRTSFKNFPWESNSEALKAWQEGKTGYPMVDAGMRELWHTGWMHNRVRLIVASFLVKDLLIPWQKGEEWFCGFLLNEDTPDHTVFTRARSKIGTELLATLFQELRDQLKKQGYMNEVFTFVDASHLITKANLWEERDEAIRQKYEKLNNEILPKVAVDKQARIGCKGKNKYWYGYKKAR